MSTKSRITFLWNVFIILFISLVFSIFYTSSWSSIRGQQISISGAEYQMYGPMKKRNTSVIRLLSPSGYEMDVSKKSPKSQNFKNNLNIVNPHNYTFIISEARTCDIVEKTEVYLMVVVCGAPGNYKQRTTIRETWGSVVHSDKSVRLVFLMGKTIDEKISKQISDESHKYRDIVQEDFIDSYKNLSIKSAAMLRWTFQYCPMAKYLLKADDDMFINIPYLLGVLRTKKIKNSVIGRKIVGARPVQNKASKWYTPKNMFNGDVYPPYCSGTSYVISGDIVGPLFHATLTTDFFWLEDIYVTGICRSKIKADVVQDWGFTYTKRRVHGCAYKSAITGHENTPQEIKKIWNDLQNKSLRC